MVDVSRTQTSPTRLPRTSRPEGRCLSNVTSGIRQNRYDRVVEVATQGRRVQGHSCTGVVVRPGDTTGTAAGSRSAGSMLCTAV